MDLDDTMDVICEKFLIKNYGVSGHVIFLTTTKFPFGGQLVSKVPFAIILSLKIAFFFALKN